jgi:hypothetical protein
MPFTRLDSFDHYATSDIGRKWLTTSPNYVNGAGLIGTGRFGTGWDSSGAGQIAFVYVPGVTSFSVGWALKYASFGYLAQRNLLASEQSAFPFALCFVLDVDIDYQLVFRRNAASSGNFFSGIVIPHNAWIYLQLSAVISVVGPDYFVAVDLSMNGGPSYIATLAMGSTGFASQQAGAVFLRANDSSSIDDVWFRDDTVKSGDMQVKALYPTADGFHSAWTPNSGSIHFNRVNQAVPDDDTTYVSSAGAGTKDSYVSQDIGSTPSVLSVQHAACARDDGGANSYRALIRQGGADYLGSAIAPTGSYAFGLSVFNTDPATGLPWTVAGVNSAEPGTEAV